MNATAVFNRRKRLFQVLGTATAMVLLASLAGCYQGAQPDTTPPRVYILKFERNTDGTQGSQTTISPGGQFTALSTWLGGFNQANIRVYGDGTHGVRKFTVSGTARGTCSTQPDNNGTVWTAPDQLSASFPTYVETSPSGTTRDFMAFTLDASVITGNSCGRHSYQGPPPNLEYFLDAPATWTITGTAENGSGLQTTGTFTIVLQ
jgi:hypothetical protein